jgi:hypothetical protein
MDNAALHFGMRKHTAYCLFKAIEVVNAGNQNILDTPALQVV